MLAFSSQHNKLKQTVYQLKAHCTRCDKMRTSDVDSSIDYNSSNLVLV